MVKISEQDTGTSFMVAQTACHFSKMTSTESQIVEMTTLRSFHENWLQRFDQNYATLFLMFQLRVTSLHDWQVKREIFEAFLTSCWLILAILKAVSFFTGNVYLGHLDLFLFAYFWANLSNFGLPMGESWKTWEETNVRRLARVTGAGLNWSFRTQF